MGKFKIFLIILLVLLLAAGWFISTGYYSTGERAGTISKFSERGYVFKTYEGQLMEGGYSGETGSLSPRYWDFSTTHDSVVVKIREALATGERVTMVYQEKFLKFPWNGDTKYIIVDLRFLAKPELQQPEESFPTPQVEEPVQEEVALPADTVGVGAETI